MHRVFVKPGLIVLLAVGAAIGLSMMQASTTLADPGGQSEKAPWDGIQLPQEAIRFAKPGVGEVLILPIDSKAIPEVRQAVERRGAKAPDCPPFTKESAAPSVQSVIGTFRWGVGLNCLPGWSADVFLNTGTNLGTVSFYRLDNDLGYAYSEELPWTCPYIQGCAVVAHGGGQVDIRIMSVSIYSLFAGVSVWNWLCLL